MSEYAVVGIGTSGASHHVIGPGLRRTFLMVCLLLAMPGSAQPDRQWMLEKATLAYHVSHPLHDTDGISRAARGKAACHAGQCDVLIAAPVKSFDSGDSNRDLHMLQATNGARFPLVSVRIRVPESDFGSSTILCDLEVEFAGQAVQYRKVSFQQVTEGIYTRISGTIPAKLSDFKIPLPSLFTVSVKDEMPIRVETTWRPM
jgi:hypothetical protein